MTVRRLLPLRLRRSVGAWCFIDHYGPMSVDGLAGMQVPPHPHIGLQTVTWLMTGNVLHRDSLGSEQMIRPGQLNLMTAGRGIAHFEESPTEHDPRLHGVQLWVALPDAARLTEPAFEHQAQLPDAGIGGFEITVFIGSLGGARSPARVFSDIVGAELVGPKTPGPGCRWNRRTSTCSSRPAGRRRWKGPSCSRVTCSTWTPGAGSHTVAVSHQVEVLSHSARHASSDFPRGERYSWQAKRTSTASDVGGCPQDLTRAHGLDPDLRPVSSGPIQSAGCKACYGAQDRRH